MKKENIRENFPNDTSRADRPMREYSQRDVMPLSYPLRWKRPSSDVLLYCMQTRFSEQLGSLPPDKELL